MAEALTARSLQGPPHCPPGALRTGWALNGKTDGSLGQEAINCICLQEWAVGRGGYNFHFLTEQKLLSLYRTN